MTFRKTLLVLAAVLLSVIPLSAAANELPTADVHIYTVHGETGEQATNVCYELSDHNFGFPAKTACDDDGDGVVTFTGITVDTYSLVQTADLGGWYPVGEPGVNLSALEIRSDVPNDIHLTLIEAGDSTDLGLITRDPESGEVIYGACYVLDGYSDVGCDDDGNGIVTFADIPWGTYTVLQMQPSEDHERMDAYEIYLQPFEENSSGMVIIPLIQADQQGHETSTNISVLVVDSETGNRVASEDTCVQFPGMTNVGCDDDVTDGQIDFAGVDPTRGQPVFEISSLACGYEAPNPHDIIMHRHGVDHLVLVLQVVPTDEECA